MTTGPLIQADYSEKANGPLSLDTSIDDITDLAAVVMTVEAGEIGEFELWCPWNAHSNAGGIVLIYITDESNVIKSIGLTAPNHVAAGVCGPARAVERIDTPGTYTRKGRTNTWAGTGTINSGATSPAPVTLTARKYLAP